MFSSTVLEHSRDNETYCTIGSQLTNRIRLLIVNPSSDNADADNTSNITSTLQAIRNVLLRIQLSIFALRRFSADTMSSYIGTTFLAWFQPTKTPVFKLSIHKFFYILMLCTNPTFSGAQDVDLASLSAYQGFRILGALAGDQVGYSVSSAGDMNGDGIEDAIVGSSKADTMTGANSFVAYVIFGRDVTPGVAPFNDIQLTSGSTALPASVGFRILRSGSILDNSLAIAAAGDVNSDGIDDVVVAAPNSNPEGKLGAGITYIVFGRNLSAPGAVLFGDVVLVASHVTMPTIIGCHLFGSAAGEHSGRSVGGGGDVNGDGIADIIIGAPGNNAGITYVFFGRTSFVTNVFPLPTTTLDVSWGFRILGAVAGDISGWSVAIAGDVNGDGMCDVIVGAPLADPPSRNDAGITYVIYGRRLSAPGAVPFGDIQLTTGVTALATTIGFRILGAATGDRSGTSVSGSADINGDGIADIVTGGNFAGPPNAVNAGIAYVVFGRSLLVQASNPFGDIELTTTAMSTLVGFRILGATTNDQVGFSVGAARDLNGDGIGDVIVGAYGADPSGRTNAGISYIIYGRNVAGGAAAFGDIQLSAGSTTLAASVG